MTNKPEINKYLTEAMGGCVHDWERLNTGGVGCKKCKRVQGKITSGIIDFFTADGFFKLWEWAMGQGWWNNFIVLLWKKNGHRYTEVSFPLMVEYIPTNYVDPDTFATEVYQYLKGREEQ